MCGMCSDIVDGCDKEECGALPRVREDGTMRSRYMVWYSFMDDQWCKHLTEEYGTSKPGLAYHVDREHWWEEESIPSPDPRPYDCVDHCVENGWWTLEEVENVVEALRKKYS